MADRFMEWKSTPIKFSCFKENQIYVIMGDYSLGNLAVMEGPKVESSPEPESHSDCPDGYLRWVLPDGVWNIAIRLRTAGWLGYLDTT